MIGSAEACSGLYLLKVDDSTSSQAHKAMSTSQCQNNSLSCFNSNKDSEIMLCHYWLGHPKFFYLEKLFPILFKNKSSKKISCEVCQFLKHVRNPYPSLSHPFSLMHSDIWGPSTE